MGRFYKTAKPEMLDFMFKVPEQAIMTAIKGADAQLEGQEAYLTDLQKQLKTAALDKDEERRKQRVAELEGKIREHSLKIWENPLLAIKEQKGIRDLGQEIYKDLTEGELYAYNTNYAARQEYYKKAVEDATGKDGRLNVDQVKNAMAAFDAQYNMQGGAQFNKETGKFNPYGTELLYDYIDKSKYAADVAEGWTSQKLESLKSEPRGAYWWDVGQKTDVLELDDLTMGIHNTMLTDPTVMQQVTQDIQLKAQAKAAQEAMVSKGDYKTLYDKYFNQFRDEEFGVIDPAKKQLKLEEVKDENGKPKINEQTGKPIMKFVNPGNLYRIAQAAADKKDKNDITTTEKMTGLDELAKINAQLDADKALAGYKKELENPVVGWNTETGEHLEQTLPGNTYDEIATELDAREQNLSTSLETYKKQLLTVLGKNATTQEELDLIDGQLKTYLGGENPNFAGLKTFLVDKGIGMGKEGLTGVDDFQKTYEKSKIDLNNKRNLLNTHLEENKENLDAWDLLQINNRDLEIADIKKQIQGYQNNINKETSSVKKQQYQQRISELENQIKKKENDKKSIIGKKINFNVNVTGNKNLTARSSLQTRGDLLQDWGISESEAKAVTRALDDLGKQPLFNWIGGASGAKIRNNDGTGMQDFKGSTLAQFFTDNNYKKEYDENGKLTITSIDDNQVVFKGKVGQYSVAVDDFDQVGANSIATRILGQRWDSGRKQWVETVYDVYIPANELTNKAVSSALSKVKDEQEFTALERKAENIAKTTVGKNYIYQHNKYVSIQPKGGEGGKPLYIFTDDNGRQEIAKTSQEALALFKKINK